MRAEMLVHLKHACRFLAKNLRKPIVSVDLAPILGILQVVFFDILLHLTDNLAAGQVIFTDDLGQVG